MNTKLGDNDRRLATIMAADIVGYSRLMDADEEGTYAALQAVRNEVIEPRIAEYGGRIVKHLGDGFLAEFPTVMAAIQFAMSLQEEAGRRAEAVPKAQQIKFRIGVNLGDVIVAEDGDVFGDGVNVAARLEGLGIPGGICISGPVYETVRKKLDVDFDDLGDQSVKNISTPVHAYDIRWPGEAGTPDERVIKPQRKPVRLIASGAIVVAAFISFGLWQMNPIEPADESAPDNSIAVLPFINMSDDESTEYFSDGISEEMLNLLAKIPELRVTSRSSAFSFKGKDFKIEDVGRELNVSNVLEGSVRKAGNQVRITAQLIKVDGDVQSWSETYDRTLDNIFAIQDEISAAVVAKLKVTLLGAAPLVHETEPQAYTLYLQARHLRGQGGSTSLEQAEMMLQQALVIDPNYTGAWIELGRVYESQLNRGMRSTEEGLNLIREVIAKALAIDPDFASAHASLGYIAMTYDNDLAAAARHFERSLQLEPTNTGTLVLVTGLVASLGRLDEARAVDDYLVARDPVNPFGYIVQGFYYRASGQWDEAIASYQTALSLSPGRSSTHSLIGVTLLLKGEPQAALEAIQKDKSLFGRIRLPMAYHALGRQEESDTALAALIEEAEQYAAYDIAYVLAYRGEAERAFEWLDKAVVYKDPGIAGIINEPMFASIHDDPRWLAFLTSIGKSPEQLAAIELKITPP